MSTKFATFTTSRGTILAELYARDCPATVENFETLATAGFFNGVRIHEVMAGKLAYTGDPLSRELPAGDPRLGTGGPGYAIPCELIGNRNTHVRGAISMDVSGPDTGGSRFFFVLDDVAGKAFDRKNTVFGQVEEGFDVLNSLQPQDVIEDVRVWE
ncbi:MAG TPA: peptidylprolyl isomerase [Gemmatimonas sp.]|nr:peptidylprolyl isomerase [Gemmatimonas sp.]